MDKRDLEKWSKIRAVMEVASVEITLADKGEKSYNDAFKVISSVASELFDTDVGSSVLLFLQENVSSIRDIPKLQEFLISKVG